MQHPKVRPVRPETKMKLLMSQRAILKMKEQATQLVGMIQAEEKGFLNLVAEEAKFLKVNPKREIFDVDKLVFYPKTRQQQKLEK